MFSTQDRSSRSSSRSRHVPSAAQTPSSSTGPRSGSTGHQPSTSPAYPFLARPHTPINHNNGDATSTSSSPLSFASSPHSQRLHALHHIRRLPSSTDLALKAERSRAASNTFGPENIGLGLLEPRPRAVSSGSLGSEASGPLVGRIGGECSWMEFMSESEGCAREVVLDGIFEVLERGM